MKPNDMEKGLVSPINMDHISNMLLNSGAMNMLFNQTKKMMWSMVEYKDLQMINNQASFRLLQKRNLYSLRADEINRQPSSFAS